MKSAKHSKSIHGSPIIDSKEESELPSAKGQGQDEPNKPDMSHVESFIDGLDAKELSHAHEHIKKKMEPPAGEKLNEGNDGTDLGYDSFMKVKNED